MRSPFLSSGRAVLILVPFLILGCNESTPPAAPDPVVPPAAAPTPAPTPTPTPAPVGCSVGPSSFNENCSRLSPAFLEDVNAAINRVVDRRPELFNFDDVRGQGGFLVRQQHAETYHQEVMVELRHAGFCAVKDANEIGVKIDNSLNDQFHIMLSSGHIRRGEASYRSTCRPAWF
jgi:hypothetical protein